MPVFLICFKFSILVNSFSNKRSEYFVHTLWNTLRKKIEKISVKILLKPAVTGFFTRVEKFSADEENWLF